MMTNLELYLCSALICMSIVAFYYANACQREKQKNKDMNNDKN